MKISKEQRLKDFRFWQGARINRKYISDLQMDQIEKILEEMYPEGIYETLLNDIFWFDTDEIAIWLGYDNWDQLMEEQAY